MSDEIKKQNFDHKRDVLIERDKEKKFKNKFEDGLKSMSPGKTKIIFYTVLFFAVIAAAVLGYKFGLRACNAFYWSKCGTTLKMCLSV